MNISSYEAKIEVTVQSNKNENKYKLSQKYSKENGAKQEILEPSNIQGVQTTMQDGKLEIKNSKLGLSTILENYQYMTENALWLSSFINDYKNSSQKGIKEENGEYIMETKVKDANNYTSCKKLYIDKNTNKPTKMLIQDKNNKTLIYILYNEIKFDSLSKEEVLAFKLENLNSNDL